MIDAVLRELHLLEERYFVCLPPNRPSRHYSWRFCWRVAHRDSHLSFAVLCVRFGCCVGRVLQKVENLAFYEVLRSFFLFFFKNQGNFPIFCCFCSESRQGSKHYINFPIFCCFCSESRQRSKHYIVKGVVATSVC